MDPEFYTVGERLGQGLREDEDAVLIVNVGGGLGHDLEEFRAKHASLAGRLVLQNRPEVIEQITSINPGLVPMAHDFFTPQPVMGARAYYLHSVLHDWDDEKSRRILSRLGLAMQLFQDSHQ